MNLDLATLGSIAVLVRLTAGVLLLLAWLQNRAASTLLYWSGGFLLSASSGVILSLSGWLTEAFADQLASAVVLGGCGLFWCGARACARRPVYPALVLVAPVLWFGLTLLPALEASQSLRYAVFSLMSLVFVLATIWELATLRERLLSRHTSIVWLGIHAAFIALSSVLHLLQTFSVEDGRAAQMAGLMLMELIVFSMAIALSVVSLTKEQLENEQRRAASTDALTGFANRRAFFSDGDGRLAIARRSGTPSAVLLLDIDHFKRINDQFGHDSGDAVLREFSNRLAATLGEHILIGRLGGEEFAALIIDCGQKLALEHAETVRKAIAARPFYLPGLELAVTVSIGVALTNSAGYRLDSLLIPADDALYAAKRSGRNNVKLAGSRAAAEADGDEAADDHDDRDAAVTTPAAA